MSEIKGQLLGMLLVLTIFGLIAGGITSAFIQTSDAIVAKVDQELGQQSS